jgi:PleD family two-component response regulator
MVVLLRGEGFLFLLNDTNLNNTKLLAKKLHYHIKGLDLQHNWTKTPITMSFGICQFGEDSESEDDA